MIGAGYPVGCPSKATIGETEAVGEVENPATGERVVFLRTAAETDGELLEMDDFWPDADHRTAKHMHPEIEERWQVVSGRVRFRIGDQERLAGPGDVVVAPPGTPHAARGDGCGPVHLRIQMRPALRWQEFVERLFALPSPEALPALLAEFPREIAIP